MLFGDAGTNPSLRKPGVGYYVSPTILGELSDGDEAWDSEIFGPVRDYIVVFAVVGCTTCVCRVALMLSYMRQARR